MSDNIVSLASRRSPRDDERKLFYCTACGCYSFKIIEIAGDLLLGCSNCEAWIGDEFTLARKPGFVE
jgi:hypothetical protein